MMYVAHVHVALLLAALQFQNFFVSGLLGGIEDLLKEDFFSIYTHTALAARNITDEHVTPDRVKYFLFTKNEVNKATEITAANLDLVANKDVQIVFLIHGWTENRERQWYEDLKNAFLSRSEDFYVVQVDWSDPANQLYTVSSYSTKDVGNIVGEFLVNLHKNFSVPLDHFLVIGHSLGGQVSGFVRKKVKELTNKKLPRISALDPAGPLFIGRPEEERLNKDDAETVFVIHTDGGTFGFKSSCGTIDFFPNGGSGQPGCKRIDLLDISSVVSDTVFCDHHRSYEYFIEAILNPSEFLATKCSSWSKFQLKMCDKEQVALGDLKTRSTGDFYFETNKDKPFAKRKNSDGKFGVNNVLKLLQH